MATEPKKKPRGIRHGVWTPESGVPIPQDIDGASVTPGPKKAAPAPKRSASALKGMMPSEAEAGADVGMDMGMYAKGGSVGSASRRADGIAKKGKTKGRML
jgi:hypothetical protein